MKTVPFVVAALVVASPFALRGQGADSARGTSFASISGSVTTSVTGSSNPSGNDIVGRLYGRRNGALAPNVVNLTIERVAATGRLDGGFRVEGWAGDNARFVKSAGLDLGRHADLWQAYATINLPLSGDGRYMQLKAGKMATLMGIEVGEDVLNQNLDVSWQDIYLEPFTETGIEIDGKFTPHVDVELRVSNGWDQVKDVNSGKTFMARLGLTPDDRTLIALTGFTGPEQADNTGNLRTGAELLFTRKVGSTTNVAGQFDMGSEKGAASGGGNATWAAAGVWVSHDLTSWATLALRGDVMDDHDGARTSGVLGFPANAGQRVESLTATLNLKRWEHLLVRPELRVDHSDLDVFGGHASQASAALGISWIFP
ncbi:MAG TPA: outer membrane beta-barrel protein [Gemmatimonadaceae bacterium]|nr:outer membrane beta-barrel protein [Gemmatimonadaceae bacterium]